MILLSHWAVGTVASLLLALWFYWRSEEEQLSLSTLIGPMIVGFVCAVMANAIPRIAPWTTAGVLLLYLIAQLYEQRQERLAKQQHHSDANTKNSD